MLIGLFALNEAQSLFAGPSCSVVGGGGAEKVLDVTWVGVKLPGAVSVVCVSFAVLGYVATALTAVEPLCNTLGWQLWWVCQSFWRIRILSPNSLSPKLKWI